MDTTGQPVLVIGGGPAGLMAAETLARAGRPVILCEAKPTVGRKFLMAGKSGLNLTKDEPPDAFRRCIGAPWLDPVLQAFGPQAVMDWARGLGQDLFTGSSGRVFPVTMKASPLLRAWLARLASLGVEMRTGWRWTGIDGDAWQFDTPQGPQQLQAVRVVLALGGASWQRLGSDGAWADILHRHGVDLAPFQPSNMGLSVDWTPLMARHFGKPVKAARLSAGNLSSRGEFVITARGLEGGGIYALSPALRSGHPVRIDLQPDRSGAEVSAALARMRPGETVSNRLRKLGLSPPAIALVQEMARADPLGSLKSLTIRHSGPRPLDEAISTAGGIRSSALTDGLELTALRGVHACGEMLDWDAPTGGYLLTACLATGAWAGQAVVRDLSAAADA